jgi:probable HAF family extracellular repeat protein
MQTQQHAIGNIRSWSARPSLRALTVLAAMGLASNVHAAVRYSITDLGTLGGGASYARGINDAGQVVGMSETASGESHAFVTVNGEMTDLGTLGGRHSFALDINDAGQVVGWSSIPSPHDESSVFDELHAFVTVNGEMTDLGTLGGGYSEAYDINNAGQVVGWSLTARGETHAFVTVDGVMTDLNVLLDPADAAVWTLREAIAINDAGQIAATGMIDGLSRAVLLTPVPLPAAVWLMGSALLGLVGLSRGKGSALARG